MVGRRTPFQEFQKNSNLSEEANVEEFKPEYFLDDLWTPFSRILYREICLGKNFVQLTMCVIASETIQQQIEGCEHLSHWISRLKSKEAILKRNKFRDLRREVLLSHAALQAQKELEQRQNLNRKRWEQLKAKQLKKCSNCNAFQSFCSCSSSTVIMMETEESKKLDEFFDSMNISTRKRKMPNILRPNCKRTKA